MANYAHPEVLVSTDWVKDNLDKPGINLVEIDVDTKAYDAGHIPGAVGFNWQTQLQDQVRRDIIGKEAFEKLVGGAGVSPKDTVILYGDNNNWFAAYGFWLFKIYGHKDVRLVHQLGHECVFIALSQAGYDGYCFSHLCTNYIRGSQRLSVQQSDSNGASLVKGIVQFSSSS